MPDWQQVAELDALPPGGLADVVVGRELVLLVRDEAGEVRAFQGLCPHEFARLAEGALEERHGSTVVRCPRHLARFRLSDGACGRGWALPPLRRYAVRVADGAVFVPDPLTPIG